jgi:hypothetical protein
VRSLLQRLGEAIAAYLVRPRPDLRPPAVVGERAWQAELRPCDVLLVDGSSKISAGIKYLTQSTWSHSALYVGDAGGSTVDGEPAVLLEADMRDGVCAVPLSKYALYNVRICRPAELAPDDVERVLRFAVESIGQQYDLRNVIDLARWLLPEPPVPARFRRRLMALGSGEPTRAICSTLIARCFQSVGYPILPSVTEEHPDGPRFRPRHHSFVTPRDFDLSPYFDVVKPSLSGTFDYRSFPWHEDARPEAASLPLARRAADPR